MTNLSNFTDILGDEIADSQPISLPSTAELELNLNNYAEQTSRPAKGTGQLGHFRSVEEIDSKYRDVFSYPFFNLVQSSVIEAALYSDKSIVVCAPTGSGKTVIFEMAIVQLLMEVEDKNYKDDFKIIYMAPVKALCTERLTEWYAKFTKLGLLCIEVTGDTDVDFGQLKAYKIIITTPEKWDMLTRRWRDHRGLVEMIKLFLIDEVHILNDETRGPVLEAVVSRMKTIEAAAQSALRIEKLQKQYRENDVDMTSYSDVSPPRIRFVAVSATVSNPEDVAAWLGTEEKPAVYYKFGDECRPVKLKRIVEGYPCADGTSIFKFDIILSYKLWPIIQKYYDGKPTLIFCNTRKSVTMTAETLSREITITFSPEQKAKLTALASTIKTKKLQSLVLAGVGCHHAGMLYEERLNIEYAFRNRDLPILITTTTLAMGVNLPAHLVIIKNTQQYVNGAYQEYSISTVLQMVGRAGRPQFDTEATAVIMTRQRDKARYQALVGGSEPLQSFLHKRLAENLNSEAALGTVGDVAQCVQWLRFTFLYVRAAKDPKRYLGLPPAAPGHQISKKIEEMCVRAMNGLATAGLITMDEASCIESTEAGRLMSIFYLDLETMKLIMKVQGNENLERLLWIVCESHELSDMHLRVDERRCLNALNRNQTAATIRFPMKGKITSRQMKLNCIIQAILGCLPIPEPSLNQEAMKIMRVAERICKCLVAYVTRPEPVIQKQKYYSAILNTIILNKCIMAHLWENSPYVSKQLKGIGPAFSTLLATAGKINFMLLEESHPRDLERIMNKGPPAGNVLRKQVSLLPKYQLFATPVDEKTVSVKLQLINQAYLAENLENLTVGEAHKCYVVAGDSENHILLLTTFKDKDLIKVFDGTMTYEITRNINIEHKLFIHCISSGFVGIDAYCEYSFNNLLAPGIHSNYFTEEANLINLTNIESTPKNPTARKRKNINEEITKSREKRKRDNALAEKFRLLRESFGKASKELKQNLENTEGMSNITLIDLVGEDKHKINNTISNTVANKKDTVSNNFNDISTKFDEFNNEEDNILQNENFDDFLDDSKIDNIIKEIESEIINCNKENITPVPKENKLKSNDNLRNCQSNISLRRKSGNKKSNYNFLDLLDKNVDLSDEETSPKPKSGFSDTIKTQIEKYLNNTNKIPSETDLLIKKICFDQTTCKTGELNEQRDVINESISQRDQKNINEKDNTQVLAMTPQQKSIIAYKKKAAGHEMKNTDIDLDDYPKCVLNMKNNIKEVHENDDSVQKRKDILIWHNNVPSAENDYSNFKIKASEHRDDVLSWHNNVPSAENDYSNFKIKASEHRDDVLSLATILPVECNLKEKHTDNNKILYNKIQLHNSDILLLPLDNRSTNEDQKIQCCKSKDYTESNDNHIIKDDFKSRYLALEGPNPSVATIFENKFHNLCEISHKSHEPEKYNLTQQKRVFNRNNVQFRHNNEKKYKYTTEKVDYHSKFTAEHEIRVIRKLKIDLDVTEIISTFTQQNVNVDKDESELLNSIFDQEFNNRDELLELDEPKKYDEYNFNKQLVQQSKLNEQAEYSVPQNQYIPTQIQNKINVYQERQEKAENDKNEDSQLGKDAIEFQVIVQENQVENSVKIDKELKLEKVPNLFTKTENKIEDILEKYSKSLRKKDNNFHAKPAKINNIIENNTKSVTIKPNRPFKISEVQKLSLPLSNIRDNNTPEPTKNINKRIEPLTRKEIPRNEENCNFQLCHDNLLQEQELEENSTLVDHEYKQYKDIECESPVKSNIDDFSQTEFKLDNSLLDPKALLMSVNKADSVEFIPPPLEFCDEPLSYSPEIENYFNNNETTFLSPDNDTNNSIFEEEPESVDLTPSKAIETWTLSCDVDSDNKSYLINPMHSRTLMHRKVSRNTPHPHISTFQFTSRQGKLSQFKYQRKSKFKNTI